MVRLLRRIPGRSPGTNVVDGLHVREQLAPFAGDDLTDNLNPVGAAYYGFSTLLCTPSSLSQGVGVALGAQAGESRLREIVTGAGFASMTRVAETPFNIVLEAKV
jgi:hypothetical protein